MNTQSLLAISLTLVGTSTALHADDFTEPAASLNGQQESIEALGGSFIVHATAGQTGGALGLWETADAAGGGPHWHTHTKEVEMHYVLEGNYRFFVGDRTFDAGPGSAVTLPPNIPHKFQNIGETEGRRLVAVTPGGFEGFFVQVDATQAKTPLAVWELEKSFGIVKSGLEAVVTSGAVTPVKK